MTAALRAFLLTIALAVLSLPAHAQSTLLQAGPPTAGHVPIYVNGGSQQPIVQDSGTAAGGGPGLGLSELGITVRGSGTAPYTNAGTGPLFTNACDYDAPTTNATGYHFLCFGPNSNGAGVLTYGAAGGAMAQPFQFVINGVTYAFPSLTPPPGTFASLPTCVSGIEGALRPVTDSTVNTWGATIAGSGGLHVLAYCDGTLWNVAAK